MVIMIPYNFQPSDILYMNPPDIMRYLTRSDFALILFCEPQTTQALELLNILLYNFEGEEMYEECCIIRDEIKRRLDKLKFNDNLTII